MKKIKYLYILLFAFILAVSFILRFYDLGKVPAGLYQDETAIGYNAYSIIKTDADEYGKTYPLYFKSFGDFKLPVYIYSAIPSIQIFGLTPFAVRFPSALFGFLTVPLFALLIFRLTKDKNLSLLAMGILAILPWHLHYSRATFEVSISLFLFTLGTYLIHKAFFGEKSKGLFLLGTLSFILGLYTYNLTRILAPLLFILILIFFRKRVIKVSKTELISTLILGIVTLIPFVLTLFNKGGSSSASGTLIFSSAAVQAPLLEFRSYLISAGFPFTGILFNKLFLTLWQFIINIASYFSVDFFFVNGSAHGNHGIGNVGLFYLFQLPFMVLGIFSIIRKRMEWGFFLIFWAIVTILVASLTRDIPHATRSFFLIVPLTAFISLGIIEFYNFLKTTPKVFKYILITCVLIVSIYNIVFYFASYYFRFPVKYAKAWSYSDQELVNFVKNEDSKFNHIIVDKSFGPKYTSFLFYLAYPPKDFQTSSVRLPDDSEGFSEVLSFGKYEFRDIDWINDTKQENTLIITSLDKVPSNVGAYKIFYYPSRPVVIPKGQEIIHFPTTDASYALVKTN